jgi:hypothetical protein
MANPTWPSSVPGPELASIRYAPAFDNHLRANAGIGGKTRRRATAVPEILSFDTYVSAAELQTLLDFYEVTLKQVLPFDWYDWRKPNDTDSLATFTFRRAPSLTPWTFGGWKASLELTQHTTFQGTFLLDIEGLST